MLLTETSNTLSDRYLKLYGWMVRVKFAGGPVKDTPVPFALGPPVVYLKRRRNVTTRRKYKKTQHSRELSLQTAEIIEWRRAWEFRNCQVSSRCLVRDESLREGSACTTGACSM